MSKDYLAIYKQNLIARGDLEGIVREVKALGGAIEPVVLNTQTCERLEFSWQGDIDTVIGNLPLPAEKPANKRGRPKLGVTSKEVTLLPRHWAWLKTQRGGASAIIRRLIDEAIENVSVEDLIHIKQNQLYNLMTHLGDLQGFEEASRALYRNSKASFAEAIESWPSELRTIIMDKFIEISDLHNGSTQGTSDSHE